MDYQLGPGPLKVDQDEINNELIGKFAWIQLANMETMENAAYDTTVTVPDVSAFRELMFTLQRVSNGRTFASATLPVTQFLNGAVYAIGSYSLFSGNLNQQTAMSVNAVAIWVSNTQVEFALNAHNEKIRLRLFGR